MKLHIDLAAGVLNLDGVIVLSWFIGIQTTQSDTEKEFSHWLLYLKKK